MELFLASFRSFVMFLFIQGFVMVVFMIFTEAQKLFNQKPVSPQNVTEDQNVTLSWSYNIGGVIQLAQLKRIYEDGSSELIVNKFPNSNPTVRSAFQGRFHVQIISDTQTTFKITGITRSDSGKYTYGITVGNLDTDESEVQILVQYKSNITTFFAGNQRLNESVLLNLTCAADGNPKPSISWTRLSDNSTINSTLEITGKHIEGEYRCTASNGVGNPDSRTVYIIVENYHPIDTIVTTNLTDNTVVVNTTFNVTCSATARPSAKYRFYKGIEFVNDTDSDGVITTFVNERVKKVDYRCVPYNFYGDGKIRVVTVTVHYHPVDTNFTTENTTVLRRSHFTLKCSTDASPTAEFHLYLNGSLNQTNNTGTFYVIAVSDAEYTCVPRNLIGTGDNATVKVTVVDAPLALLSPLEVTANVNDTLNLTCTVFGNPKPSIKWSKDGSSYVPCNDSLCTVTVSRHGALNDVIQYQCTASNGVGTPDTATASITVHYPAMISEPGNVTLNVTVGEKVNFSCNGTGNPKPIITLVAIFGEASNRKNVSESNSFEAKPDSAVRFLCTVENALAKKVKWIHLVLNAMEFEITLTIINKACRDNPGEVMKQLREHVIEILKKWNIPIEHITTITYECGSVTVYLSLIFSQNVEIENVLTVLKKASAEERGFGDLKVDPESIQAISPERIPTTPTPTPVDMTTEEHPSGPKCKESFIPESNCPLSVAFIVFLVVLAVILFSVTFAIIIYCLYKRRKCRKDPRVHGTQSEERPFSPSNKNDYSQVNSGYAETGPRSTERANLDHNQEEEGAAAIPDYAVVDKSKKKGKKKDKRAAEMKPTEDQYAIVDKSKKKTKLKNEPDATYAEVDCQKNSKKKPKPGDVLYADLGEFHQMKKMPAVSTSPKALPPIKRPEAYAETQYADITQFPKGNPEDPGAELPKDNTTPAVKNTANGSKEESSARNTGNTF
ncbi:hemicentin-1-like isoform X2 [Stylophora pistillata]|uniref:hemicentin-1-like isoform X2 n=1 Tax=Stylophora pistillata TaxID=50429 RepID=UPI000C04BCD0|nr:hemicentin-1-like isoform X2 [Stylophora pistillata]